MVDFEFIVMLEEVDAIMMMFVEGNTEDPDYQHTQVLEAVGGSGGD